jgi:hypothetical protein
MANAADVPVAVRREVEAVASRRFVCLVQPPPVATPPPPADDRDRGDDEGKGKEHKKDKKHGHEGDD